MSPNRTYEQLESRRPLAGNVTAAVINGALQITGDDDNNQIDVRQTSAGDFRLTGINTKVNGGRSFLVSDNVTSIHVDLGAGRDSLNLFGAELTGDLRITNTAGGDRVSLQRVDVRGETEVNLSAGDDVVMLSRASLMGNTNLNLGGGNDVLSAIRVAASGALNAVGGDGHDRLTFNQITGDAALTAHLDGGNDSLTLRQAELGSLAVTGGAGRDTVMIDRVMTDLSATVDLGAGRDRLVVLRSDFAGGINITPDALDTVITRGVEGLADPVTSPTPVTPAAGRALATPSKVPPSPTVIIPPVPEATDPPPRVDRNGNPISEERYQQLVQLLGLDWFQGGIGF